MPVRTVTATRYVTPLREGGSLPAIVEADDLGHYVLKFRGAGQGKKALVAELVGAELGRRLGLPVPEVVFLELDPLLGRSEPDFEIRTLIQASAGTNLGLDYLPGAIAYDPLLEPPDPALASAIVWFDALITNVDRTARNTNLLRWHGRLYLIDHGAALYFHHTWSDARARATQPFTGIRDHVLLPFASALRRADDTLPARLGPDVLREVLAEIPDAWLDPEPGLADPAAVRDAYLRYLELRLAGPRAFAEEAVRAHAEHV